MKEKNFVPYHPKPEPRYDFEISAGAVKDIFRDAADFCSRQVTCPGGYRAEICFIDGLVSGGEIADYVLKPLMSSTAAANSADELVEILKQSEIYAANGKTATDMDKVCFCLVNGFVVIIIEGASSALVFEARTGEKRGISAPNVENTVKGSKDAFVETIRTNTSLVRRHLRTPELRIKEKIVGRQTLTNVSILYIEGITNEAMVAELENRLDAIDVDGVLTMATLDEYLFEKRSLFPKLIYTERTDRFCFELMGGRPGLLVDGMPVGFLLPATLALIMKTPEDRSENNIVASCLRLLRYTALVLTLLLPGVYLAVRGFHSEMIPEVMLNSILESKQKVASGTPFEVISLLLCFELLQEAGLRMPQNIGQTIGVIGGLVVGTAAVEANIISPVVLVIVAMAGVAGYTLPNQDFSNAVRVWRFLIVLAAWGFGLLGVQLACLALLVSLCSIESFNVPFLMPFTTADPLRIIGNMAVRPIRKEKYRDEELQTKNIRSRK